LAPPNSVAQPAVASSSAASARPGEVTGGTRGRRLIVRLLGACGRLGSGDVSTSQAPFPPC